MLNERGQFVNDEKLNLTLIIKKMKIRKINIHFDFVSLFSFLRMRSKFFSQFSFQGLDQKLYIPNNKNFNVDY